MSIALDHMSVPAHDHVATARWFADVFGTSYDGPRRDYAPVILSDGLTLNFEQSEVKETHHYAFRVEPAEFDSVRAHLDAAEIPYGDTTRNLNGEIYIRLGLKGFYFEDPNGHGLEVITKE